MLLSTRALGCAAFLAAPCALHAQSLFAPGFESPGVSGSISALQPFDPDGAGPAPSALYAGGEFAATAFGPAPNLAAWNGTSWSDVAGGTNGWIGALETFDADGDGPGAPALYLAGAFTSAGGVSAASVARFDGTSFTPLGAGLDDWAGALAVFDDDGAGPHPAALYVGGMFEHSGALALGNVARWNGTAFEPLGSGLDAPVAAMTVFDGALYVGGFFSTAGGVSASSIARWTGTAWQTVGAGFDGPVQALTVHDPDGSGPQPAVLLAGGAFKTSGSVVVNGIAQWNGSTWSALGAGVLAPGAYPSIRGLKSIQEGASWKVYATGLFQEAGSASAATPIVPDAPGCGGLLIVARWDGTAWTTLGSGFESNADDIGRTLASFDDDHDGNASLFVGGHFKVAGPGSASGIARWSGTEWRSLGTGQGLGAGVNALAEVGSPPKVAAAGRFTAAGTVPANRVALWDGTAWQAIGNGAAGSLLDGDVNALLPQGGGLVLGGAFQKSNGTTVNHVARWAGPGSDLVPLGAGTDGDVHALALFGGRVVAGGAFAAAGGAPAYGIAQWDDATGTWSALAGGIGGSVHALVVFDDGSGAALYAGGDFEKAGTVAAAGIARWNGSTWSALGEGLCCGSVNALCVFDDGLGPALYAGGKFDGSGLSGVNGIARWNPASGTWMPLASGVEGGRPVSVFALASSNGALVVGGEFQLAGGIQTPGLARWSGTAWSGYGTGADGAVRALLSHAGTDAGLYLGGDFTVIDGRATSRMARVP